MNRKFPAAEPLFHAAAAVFAAALLLSSCELYGTVGGDVANIAGALPQLLQGEWAYIPPGSEIASETYTITAETIEYGGNSGGDDIGTGFTGTIRFVSNYSSGSGVIIIEYTEKPAYDKYNGLDFFGIYYRNLEAGSVQLANATTFPDYSAPDTATLDEAVAKFTRMEMGRYVDWSVVNPQRRIR
ncbi:MAG: hypothetical protein LBH70_00930 [Spirochaetaceae bacterium]|jgi:hypothetical protein|nr:hypothetical protein [Spirochaetaceae bacterium]